MPETVIMGVIEEDGSYHCTEGVEDGVLPGCLPMNFNTWYVTNQNNSSTKFTYHFS